jgi:serine/threonine protein kinase
MRERVESGAVIDGYRVGERIHAGGNGSIFRATAPADRDPGFAVIIKAPLLGRGESSIGIVSFEIEQLILPTLSGAHVPRFVHAGDITTTPFIVMEWIAGRSLSDVCEPAPLSADQVAVVGAALADAVQSVHAQHVIHLDIKPENFILRPNGDAVLLDFGFARHERYPDLLAEELQFAAGSGPYVSPEQLQDDRSDPRSDLFALGVLLYQLATGGLPFGEPLTLTGMRDRLWREPLPPRAVNRQVPSWLQEVILHCLEPDADARYSSAAQIAFDLRHPEQIEPTARGERTQGQGFTVQLIRWWRMRHGTRLSRLRAPAAASRPSIIMVAVDTEHPEDERHSPLRFATAQILSLDPAYRLMCVSVIKSAPMGELTQEAETTTGRHVEHKARLRHWVASLKLPPSRISLHVVEAVNAADTLLDLARTNHVGLIVLGAPGPSRTRLGWWRSAASTVTANAPCSVHVVRVPERSDASRP